VAQLSLFSAETTPVTLVHLAGLLCGPGQVVRFGTGDTARLSTVLATPSWAPVLTRECQAAGVPLTTVVTEAGTTAVRSAFRRDLVDLAVGWTRGATKTVPPGLQLDGATLRMWVLAAGRPHGSGGYLLGLDAHAPQTHLPLVAALTRLGLPPARVGRGAALRISGIRRVRRLVELVGPPPTGLGDGQWPCCRRGPSQ